MKIVIVGAGVAGCIMARSLNKLRGMDVTCLERVSRDDHSESGTGLNVGPNAVAALQAHDPELAAAVTAASFPWQSWKTSLTDGRLLIDLPLSRVARNDGWRIRWSELYRVLRENAPNIQFDCEVESAGPDPASPGQCVVTWRQGGVLHRLDGIDLLIVADGRYSKLRKMLNGEPVLRHIGVAISRVLVPDDAGGLIDDYEQWFNGPNRLLAFRVPPSHVYIACTFPIEPGGVIADERKAPAALRAAYTPTGGPPSAQCKWLIDTVCAHAEEMHWARMQEHNILYADPGYPALYLGDAAHGMVPTLGQGATQAIEDACAAARRIAHEWAAGRREPRHWLTTIEELRRNRVDFVMRFSLDATDSMLAGADPVARTLHKSEHDFMAKLADLYRNPPDQPDQSGFSSGHGGRVTA